MTEVISCPLTETQKLELCREFSLASTILLRVFHKAYGDDSLTVVREFGKTLSDTLYERSKGLKGKSLREIVMPFFCLIDALGGGPIEVIEDSEKKIVYRVHKCPSAFEFSDTDEKLCRTLNILEENYANQMGLGYTFLRRRSPENNTCEKCFFRLAK
jgi:predicted hydrocarbon binding protein